MSVRKLFSVSILISIAFFFLLVKGADALSVLTAPQGGTGIGSATAGDVGNCLKILDDSPFTYELGSCGAGGGGERHQTALSRGRSWGAPTRRDQVAWHQEQGDAGVWAGALLQARRLLLSSQPAEVLPRVCRVPSRDPEGHPRRVELPGERVGTPLQHHALPRGARDT